MSDCFFRSLEKWPEKNALHINDQFYSYAALNEMATSVFGQLCEYQPFPVIAIYTSEDAWTYAAILAVSGSGAAYLPLHPKLPADRKKEILKKSSVRFIISTTELDFDAGCEVLIIDANARKKEIKRLTDQPVSYLLFTSGSTGKPKGVPVSHSNIAAFIRHFETTYDFNSNDRFLQPYELSFDVSVFSIFSAWNAGACVYVVPSEGLRYFNIMDALTKHRITVSSMVPTVIAYMEKYLSGLSFPDLRYSFFAGDRLLHAHAVKWQKSVPNARIIDCYGPTETTIVCTSYDWDEQLSETESFNGIVPIGRLFPGMDFFISGNGGTEAGELWVAGTQVIEQYLNNEFPERFSDRDGKRYYNTGDLVSLNQNGNLLFHGRSDSQFKLGGYRIEAAEIENAIFSITGQVSKVILTGSFPNEKMVAFIEGEFDKAHLLQRLPEKLAAYMIPNDIVSVSKFPLNLNGKIDIHILKEQYERSVSGN